MTSTLNADERSTLVETLTALRMEVAALADRVAKLESAGATGGADGPAVASPAEAQHPSPKGVTPDIIAVITAALAAYLGVKPHIRQITMVGGAAWAQQGRVTIQASHSLTIPRD
jgi:methylmalonyl-CoA carboxyltransferase large subunit